MLLFIMDGITGCSSKKTTVVNCCCCSTYLKEKFHYKCRGKGFIPLLTHFISYLKWSLKENCYWLPPIENGCLTHIPPRGTENTWNGGHQNAQNVRFYVYKYVKGINLINMTKKDIKFFFDVSEHRFKKLHVPKIETPTSSKLASSFALVQFCNFWHDYSLNIVLHSVQFLPYYKPFFQAFL